MNSTVRSKIVFYIRNFLLCSMVFFVACSPGICLKKDINTTQNGLREGVWIEVSDSTKMLEVSVYRKGVLNGPYIRYHANGVVAVHGKYRNGKKAGKWMYCYNNHACVSVMWYKNDSVRKQVLYPPPMDF